MVANVFGMGGGSGRWGDDAVEEDLARCDANNHYEDQDHPQYHHSRDQEHEHGSFAAHRSMHGDSHQGEERRNFAHAVQGYARTMERDRHARYEYPADDRYRPSYRGDRAWREQGYDSPPRRFSDEREGYSHHHHQHSNQDARYGPQAHRSGYVYGRYHDPREDEYRRREEYRPYQYDYRNYERDYRGHIPEPHHPRLVQRLGHYSPQRNPTQFDNQDMYQNQARTAPARLWQSTNNGPHNPWRMSDAEVAWNGQAHPHDLPAATVPKESQPVRILKRTGPRMLFDPKTGTLVSVDERGSSRTPRASGDTEMEPDTSSEGRVIHRAIDGQQDEPAAPMKKDPATSSALEVMRTSPASELREASSLSAIEREATPEEVIQEDAAANGTDYVGRSKPRDARTKRLSTRGKLKKVVVVYRPVTKAAAEPFSSKVEQQPDTLREHSEAQLDLSKARVALGRSVPNQRPDRAAATQKTRPVRQKKEGETELSNHVSIRRDRERQSEDDGHRSKRSNRKERKPKSSSISTEPEIDTYPSTSAQPLNDDSFEATEEHPFVTVKSRRAIQQEKKQHREALAVALSGFHMRGGIPVQAPARAVIPSTIARFGKSGITVGLRQKAPDAVESDTRKLTPSAKPAPPASDAPPVPLHRSFKDVIRPPSPVATPVAGSSDKDANCSEQSVAKKQRQKNGKKQTTATTSAAKAAVKKDAKPRVRRGTIPDTGKPDTTAPALEALSMTPGSVVEKAATCTPVDREEQLPRRPKGRMSKQAPKPPRMVYVVKQPQSPEGGTPSSSSETVVHVPGPVSGKSETSASPRDQDTLRATTPPETTKQRERREPRPKSTNKDVAKVPKTKHRSNRAESTRHNQDQASEALTTERALVTATIEGKEREQHSLKPSDRGAASGPSQPKRRPSRNISIATKTLVPKHTPKTLKQVYVVKNSSTAATSTAA